MTRSGGYVMCRFPRCVPFVTTEERWIAMPLHQARITTEDGK